MLMGSTLKEAGGGFPRKDASRYEVVMNRKSDPSQRHVLEPPMCALPAPWPIAAAET